MSVTGAFTTHGRRALRLLLLPIVLPVSLLLSDARAAAPLPVLRPSPGASVPLPVLRPPNLSDSPFTTAYRRAFKLAEAGRWSAVLRQQRNPARPELERALRGMYLADPKTRADFEGITSFLDGAPVWPDRIDLVRRAEALIDDRAPLARRLAWFAANPPRSAAGHIARADALKRSGRRDEWVGAVRETWAWFPFNRNETRRFLKTHAGALDRRLHWSRLDRLLWRGHASAARATLPLVPPEYRHLARARLRLRSSAPNVDAAIRRVPAGLRADPGLAYERLRWRGRKDRHDGIHELLGQSPRGTRHAALWWRERRLQLRDALNDDRIEDAVRLAAGHRQEHGASRADAEWHAGWVALRFAGNHVAALRHFTSMYDAVRTPISRARAAYWAGRALDAARRDEARDWYRRAARYGTTFYGQLAAKRISLTLQLPPSAPVPRRARFARPGMAAISGIAASLNRVGLDRQAHRFLKAMVRDFETPEEAAAIAVLARDLGRREIGVMIARKTALQDVHLMDSAYPVIALPADIPVEAALVHAIIRQESNFDTEARSSAGALGLMQLRPATARHLVRGMNRTFSVESLTARPQENIRLGAMYLKRLLTRFDGDLVLAIAAYNAGPGRVRGWIRRFGNPGNPSVDTIDWIERIPYSETRNYVQRVIEALQVYRVRMGRAPASWRVGARPATAGAQAFHRPRGPASLPTPKAGHREARQRRNRPDDRT